MLNDPKDPGIVNNITLQEIAKITTLLQKHFFINLKQKEFSLNYRRVYIEEPQ